MQRSSWIMLGICAVLAGVLGFGYVLSRAASPTLTQTQATEMLQKISSAMSRKDAGTLMAYIDPNPETRVANLKQDQMRLLLIRYFRSSGKINVRTSNVSFVNKGATADLNFDLTVTNSQTGMEAQDYEGNVTLHLKRVDVPRLLGLYQGKEWRVTGADHTGKDLTSFSDF